MMQPDKGTADTMHVEETNMKIATLGRDCDTNGEGVFRAADDCSGPDSAATDAHSLAHLAFGAHREKLDSCLGSVAEDDDRHHMRDTRGRRDHQKDRSRRDSDEQETARGGPDHVYRYRRTSNAHRQVSFARRSDRGFEHLHERYGCVNNMIERNSTLSGPG